MKYGAVRGENLPLNPDTRRRLRGRFVELSDGVTHFELNGPEGGPVVVLTGGLTIPLFYWDAVVRRLHAQGFRTLAYSMYGRGYSDRLQSPYDDALFARQLRELRAALDLPPRIHLVGPSMGAIVSALHVDEDPASVSTLTLIGPAGLSDSTARQQRLLRHDLVAELVARTVGRRVLFGHLRHNVADQTLLGPLIEMVADSSQYEGSMYAFISTLQHLPLFGRASLYAAAGSHNIPTMLIWGRKDRVTPIDALEQARDLLHPQRVEVLDRPGHMAAFEAPDDVADLIASFIAPTRPA